MSLRFLKIALVFFFLALCWTANAQEKLENQQAQEKTDAELAIAIADKLAAYTPILSEDITPETDRHILMDMVLRRTSDAWAEPLIAYKRRSQSRSANNYHLIPVFESALAVQTMSNEDYNQSTSYSALVSLSSSNDWVVANRANIVLSIESSLRGFPKRAMTYAQVAVNIIPTDGDTILIPEARYETSDLLHTLFTREVNIPETIRFTEQLVDLGIQANRKLDKTGILHNVMDIFYEMGDYKTANDIALTMVAITDDRNELYQALASYDLGRTYLSLGNYDQASEVLKATLAFEAPPSIEISTLSYLAYSLAVQEQFSQSQRRIKQAHRLIESSPYFKNDHFLFLTKAEALNYANAGDHTKAMASMVQWADGEVLKKSRALSKSRVDSSNRLAATQMLKNEQIERLEEANKLNDKIIQRTYIVAFLLFMVLILTLIGLGIVLINKRKIAILNTELTKTNAELLVSMDEALAAEKAKSQFLAVMSHELRTPLNGIIAMSDLVSQQTLDPQTKAGIDIIAESSERLYALIKNVLIAAEIDDQKLDDNASNNLFVECSRLVKKYRPEALKKNLVFSAVSTKSLNAIYDYNSNVLDIVINNLLSNAVKFTQAGEVSTHFGIETASDGTAALSVKIVDTGVGMSEELVNKARDLFFQNDSTMTRQFDGAGLGLHVVNKLIESVGGTLTISSVLGSGTTVTATIPVSCSVESPSYTQLAPAA